MALFQTLGNLESKPEGNSQLSGEVEKVKL